MKIVRVLAAVGCLLATSAAAEPVHLDRAAFVGVSVVDIEAGRIVPDRTVFVAGGRIESIEPAAAARVPASVLTIDGRGRYLMPGLADLHVHHTASGAFPEPGEHPLFGEEDLALYLVYGITTVRNMAGSPIDPLLASKVRSGRTLGPRYRTTGPPIVTAKSDHAVTDAASARQEVLRQKRAGYDFVKVYCCFEPSNRPAWAALVEAAAEAGLPVVGHVPWELPLDEALRMASIEHLEHLPKLFDDLPAPDRQARLDRLVDSGVYVTPTLVPFESPGLSDPASRAAFLASERARFVSPSLWERETVSFEDGSSWYLQAGAEEQAAEWLPEMMRFTRMLHESGVPLLAGSDSGALLHVVPGDGLHRELELLAEAGLSPAEVLRTATVNAARFLGVDGVRGTVAVGYDADLVLLEENPLESISATRTIVGVMVGRTWLAEETLISLRSRLRQR